MRNELNSKRSILESQYFKSMELKDFKPVFGTVFKANGKIYTVEKEIHPNRLIQALKIMPYIFHHRTEFYKDLHFILDNIHSFKIEDAKEKIIELYKKVELVYNIKKPEDMPVIRYCALIINYENEDRSSFNEKLIEEKVYDWNVEPYAYNSFEKLYENTKSVIGLKN